MTAGNQRIPADVYAKIGRLVRRLLADRRAGREDISIEQYVAGEKFQRREYAAEARLGLEMAEALFDLRLTNANESSMVAGRLPSLAGFGIGHALLAEAQLQPTAEPDPALEGQRHAEGSARTIRRQRKPR